MPALLRGPTDAGADTQLPARDGRTSPSPLASATDAHGEDLFRAALQGMGEAMLLTDDDDRIVFANGQAEAIFDAGALQGRRLNELFDPARMTEVEGGVRREFRLHSTSPTWLQLQSTPWRQADGTAVGSVHTLRDVSERRELELQLQQSQKMEVLGRFAGGIAHDLNNFLMVVQNAAQLMADDSVAPASSSEYLPQLLRASKRSLELVAELVAFSRKQTAQARRVVDPNRLVNRTELILRRLIPEHIQIRTRFAEAPGSVRVDPGQLEQVILNLVLNARDAITHEGMIVLQTRTRDWTAADRERHPFVPVGSYVSISVTDNGCGMDPKTLSSLFEPFFTTKPAGKGTGLGLSMAYRLVKQNGGYILAESEAGEGSRFEVLLPRLDAVAEQLDHPSLPGHIPQGRGTVLLVEDHESLRRLLRGLLRKAGYVVLEARNGQEALELYHSRAAPVDLLLTDVVMPEMGGPTLASTLREVQPDLRVIYISGYTGDALPGLGGFEDTDVFLPKPFGPDQLARVLEQAMAARAPAQAGAPAGVI